MCPGVTKYTLHHDQVGCTETRDLEEFNKAHAQFQRFCQDRKVLKVEFYERDLDEKVRKNFDAFEAKVDHLPGNEKLWVFHGTTEHSVIECIMKDGFMVGGDDGVPVRHGAVHGRGIYTATGPTVPIGYAGGTHAVILALGLTGGENNVTRVNTDWIIFKESTQLLPSCVVYY